MYTYLNLLTKIFLALSMVLLTNSLIQGQYVQKGSKLLGTQTNSFFGAPTAFNKDGTVMALGGPGCDLITPSGTLVGIGLVQLYQWQEGNWIQKGNPIIGEAAINASGGAVSLSADGNTVAIGAKRNSDNGVEAGQVRIYEWNGTNWTQKGLDIDGEAAGNQSGHSVSISADGNTVAIGAKYNGNAAGHTRIYEWNGSNWIQKGLDIDGEATSDNAGQAVSMSANGNIVAIGAPYNDGNGSNSGHTRIYEWNGTNWIQKGLDIDGETGGSLAGYSVSINDNGTVVIIGATGNSANGINAGHARIYEWNGSGWIQKGTDIDGEAAYDVSGHSVDISADGNKVIIGALAASTHGNNTGQARIYEWNGSDWIQKGIDIDGEAAGDYLGYSVSMSGDGHTILISSSGSDDNGLNTGKAQAFSFSNVHGQAYLDATPNCQQDALEIGLANRPLVIQPGNRVIQTTAGGLWGLDSLPAGTYTITTDTNPNSNYQACAPSYTFTVVHPDSIIEVQSIGYQSTQPCTSPSISINAPFLRPGFSNQRVYVQACNDFDATAILDSAFVLVTLDSLLSVDTASQAYTNLGNNTYSVNVGDLYPGQCTNFWLDCTLSPTAILGSSLCLEAQLYPVDSCALDSLPNTNIGLPCTTHFDGSHLDIYGNCDNNDSISFTITNTEADMSCVSEVRLYIDGVLIRIDSVQLLSNQSQTFTFQGDGRTWRMEVDQHPLHWGNSQPSATIELCGNAANWTPNLVNILPHDDADPVVDIFCGLVTGSYDPNDKTGFPTGIGTTHDILPNQKIEYLIRFQNTGTDTAFTVVIRDTLSTDFDIFSVQSGVSSHNYSFRMYDARVLEWTFNKIMLPDSNVNEPASNGFVTFTVDQVPNLPNGVVLENSAGIYFDFNAPIITNTSTHTINDGVIILDMTAPISKQIQLKVYPNPTENWVTVELGEAENFSITVLNQLGQVLQTQQANRNSSQVQLGQLPAGIYYLHIHDGEQTAVQKVIKQ